jgi:hypothetical protein
VRLNRTVSEAIGILYSKMIEDKSCFRCVVRLQSGCLQMRNGEGIVICISVRSPLKWVRWARELREHMNFFKGGEYTWRYFKVKRVC